MNKRKKLILSIGFAVILVTCIILAILLIREINNTYDPLDKSLIVPVFMSLLFPIILEELSLLRSVYKLICFSPKHSSKICYTISIVIVCAALFFQLLVYTGLVTENIMPEGPVAASSRFIEMLLLIEWAAVNALALEAFPPEEYLAPETLAEMARAENLDFLALLDGDGFVGFMVVQTHKDLAYLFFLAIDPSCRAKGYGSCAIETLKAQYPGKTQVVDFEMLDENAGNYRQREKRRKFYLRNGYLETGHFLSYLGVDYEIFCMDESFVLDDFKELMSTLHIPGFDPVYFTK